MSHKGSQSIKKMLCVLCVFVGNILRQNIRNIALVATRLRVFSPIEIVKDCRDPKDNKFVELAIFSNAPCIISGDKDLPVLHLPLLNATDFVNNF